DASLADQPLAERQVVLAADRRIVDELEIRAAYRQQLEFGRGQQRAETVALGLVEARQVKIMLRIALEHLGKCPLRRLKRAERQVLVDLAKFGAERGRSNAVADLPARAVIGL